MKRINVHTWRGQAPRGIRTVNTTAFGGIVLVPTILMVFLLGILLIACPEAGSSSGGGSQATVETIARANNGITAKWQASAGASGYIVTVTNEKGDVVVRKSVASVTDKNDYELDIDQLPKGTHKVSISTEENPDAAIATSKEISISTEPIVAVYKAHVSADNSAHRDKFSLGDYNDPGLLKIAGLKDGSKPRYEIKVSAGSTSIHTLAKQQIAEKVPSSGTNKGITYVGLAMDAATAAKWRGITVGSDVTITLTVYDDAGTKELLKQTITPKKSPNGSIYSWRGLQNMQDDLNGTYKLENDIEFPAPDTKGFKNFTPVGSTATSAFTGKLDGNNKQVSKLYIDHNAINAGLFGYVKAKTKDTDVIQNLTLEDPTVKSAESFVGILVGQLHTGTVSNVHVQGADGTVESKNSNVGGLVGQVVTTNGVVSSSSSSARVEGTQNIGGLVGYNKGTVRGYATGKVSGTDYVGGLVGFNPSGTLTGYATGAVSGNTWVGGLVGYNPSGTLTGYATGAISGESYYVGGLVGQNGGTARGYATGKVSGNTRVGGLVGSNTGTLRGYALGYVIKKGASAKDVGPGIGKVDGTPTAKVYVGRTSEEAGKTAGAGDHVGVIAKEGLTGTDVPSVTKSNGAAPQGIVIEGSGRNVAKTDTTAAVLYSKNEKSFDGFFGGAGAGEWTLGDDDYWPILNFAADFADGARTQDPSIPTKPTQQDPNDATKTLEFYE